MFLLCCSASFSFSLAFLFIIMLIFGCPSIFSHFIFDSKRLGLSVKRLVWFQQCANTITRTIWRSKIWYYVCEELWESLCVCGGIDGYHTFKIAFAFVAPNRQFNSIHTTHTHTYITWNGMSISISPSNCLHSPICRNCKVRDSFHHLSSGRTCFCCWCFFCIFTYIQRNELLKTQDSNQCTYELCFLLVFLLFR